MTSSRDFLKSLPEFEALEAIECECPMHGKYLQKRVKLGAQILPGTPCPECERENERAMMAEQARKNRIASVETLLRNSGIPARHRGKNFDGFDARTQAQRHALNVASKYAEAIAAKAEPAGASLLLIGPPGTGKTHLAAAIGEAAANALQGIAYTTCSEMTRRFRATYTNGSEETETRLHDQLAGVRLLILDELGTSALSDHERRLLFDVVDTRYRELRPMVLLSNLPVNELAAVIGERVVDRLREMATTVAFPWNSHRGGLRAVA
jgi:DNA replication protein DnaC